MLMVFLAQGTPLVAIFNLTYVSSEILHTLVGSFGLVLVAPLTAVIGGFIYYKTDTPSETSDEDIGITGGGARVEDLEAAFQKKTVVEGKTNW